jgi:glycosyltransferase involved in cell wall biosynthesis
MDSPKVSIIVGCFMQEEYVAKAYWSAVNQDYPNVEVIVNHDGCTGPKPGRGASAARNYAIEEIATGEYVICLDADDLLPSNYVSTLMEMMGGNDKCFAGCPVQFITGKTLARFGNMEYGEYGIDAFKYSVPQIPAAAMFPIQGWIQVFGYDTNMVTMEDFDFWYRLLSFGYSYYHTMDTCLLKTNDGMGKVHRTPTSVRQAAIDKMNMKYGLELTLPELIK